MQPQAHQASWNFFFKDLKLLCPASGKRNDALLLNRSDMMAEPEPKLGLDVDSLLGLSSYSAQHVHGRGKAKYGDLVKLS